MCVQVFLSDVEDFGKVIQIRGGYDQYFFFSYVVILVLVYYNMKNVELGRKCSIFQDILSFGNVYFCIVIFFVYV